MIRTHAVAEGVRLGHIEGGVEGVDERSRIPVGGSAEQRSHRVGTADRFDVIRVQGYVRRFADLALTDVNRVAVLEILRPLHDTPLVQMGKESVPLIVPAIYVQ